MENESCIYHHSCQEVVYSSKTETSARKPKPTTKENPLVVNFEESSIESDGEKLANLGNKTLFFLKTNIL